jgi:quercetin dioxygenase-like cupin family protein
MELKEVHKDERRSINLIENLLPDRKEFTIINLNKNKAIGGCTHPTGEYFCVINGTINAKIGNSVRIMTAGQSGYIMANYPHMFFGITDAIVIEWGVLPENKGTHDKDMRDEVNRINDKP